MSAGPLIVKARWLRDRATDLRRMADELVAEAKLLERQAEPIPPLGGMELRNTAVLVLADQSAVGPHHRGIYYRDLLTAVENRLDRRVGGRKPDATLLANIARDERIETAGSRTGRYRLVVGYEQIKVADHRLRAVAA